MIEQLIRQVREAKESAQQRDALICLRREIKKEEERKAFCAAVGDDRAFLIALLDSEDPKVRKNAALILGETGTQEAFPVLLEKYLGEETLFIRADYLKAMAHLDCAPGLDALRESMEKLDETEPKEDTRKHLMEERTAMRRLLSAYETPGKHVFSGYDRVSEVILVTNRQQPEATRRQVKTGTVVPMALGLRVKDPDIRELMQIRTWSEMLFPIPGARALKGSAREVARGILAMKTAEYLEQLHAPGGSFYFRLEIKGPMDPAGRADFVKRLCACLEEESRGRLRNAAGSYEVEIRLLLRKDGSFLPMLKLFTLKDERFAYRKESTAASMSPVNAALAAQLALPYLKEGAQILDPFCGSGTLLIERNHALRADPIYGVDIFGEAVEKARKNAEADGCRIWFINRDFFEFTHEYLFDEIITELPRFSGEEEGASMETLCRRFFEKADTHLRTGGVMVICCSCRQLLGRIASESSVWEVREQYELSEKSGACVMVITKTKIKNC